MSLQFAVSMALTSSTLPQRAWSYMVQQVWRLAESLRHHAAKHLLKLCVMGAGDGVPEEQRPSKQMQHRMQHIERTKAGAGTGSK